MNLKKLKMQKYDYLIVEAGIYSSVFAEVKRK